MWENVLETMYNTFLVLFNFCVCCILRYLVCIVVSCLVRIVVVVLCVFLSSYVYLLYYVRIAVLTLDAGLLAVSLFGRSCDRPPRHRFFLVSLCL